MINTFKHKVFDESLVKKFFCLFAFFLLIFLFAFIFINKEKFLFSASPSLSGRQANLNKRVKREEGKEVSCHILNHDAAYGKLWTSIFKITFPWLKKNGIKKIWVITDVNQPIISKQFDVSAFDYHGVKKYKNWSDIPDQEKCDWFNKYPNKFVENPWLSAPFLSLRGLMFYIAGNIKHLGGSVRGGGLHRWKYYYKKYKTTKFFTGVDHNLDISYFLNLEAKQIFQTLATQRFDSLKANVPKNFLYFLGKLFLNFNPKSADGSLIIDTFKIVEDFHKKKNPKVSPYWLGFNWKMWNTLISLVGKEQYYLYLYYVLKPLLWELAHYQIKTVNGVNIEDLNKEVIRIQRDKNTFQKYHYAVNYYSFSPKAVDQILQLFNKLFPTGSSLSKAKTTLLNLIKKSKEKIFWNILKIYLSSLAKNKITKINDIAINLLFSEATKKTFQTLSPEAKKIINELIGQFFPAELNPEKQMLALIEFHKNDYFQEINALFEKLNQLIKKKDSNFCPALVDPKYQKWWEEIFRPLVPKLIEHKITRIDYGLRESEPVWKWVIYFKDAYLNPSTANYYGTLDYTSYQSLPQSIKCQIPSFLFQSKRIKPLRSLNIYLNVILPRLEEYKKHNFEDFPPFQQYFQIPFQLNVFQDVAEATVFSLLKKASNRTKLEVIYYLGVLVKTDQRQQNQYLHALDQYFLWSQFWKDTKNS